LTRRTHVAPQPPGIPSPLLCHDVTVIAWIDGSPIQLPEGATPDSCFGGGSSFAGEANPQNKTSGKRADYVWSLNEFRVGPDSQAANAYLNKRGQWPATAMPGVWATTQLDTNGKVLPLIQSPQGTAQIFPTY